LWTRASKTVSEKGVHLELHALVNRRPVKGVSDEKDMWENFVMPTMRWAAALRTA